MSKTPVDSIKKQRDKSSGDDQLAFTKKNYYILITGTIMVIIGFFLMAGGGSEDPAVFNKEIFSFRRLTLAPIFVMGGYAVVFIAIMKRFPREREKEQQA